MDAQREEEALLILRDWIDESEATDMLVGPGVSVDAGIPSWWGLTGSLEARETSVLVTRQRLIRSPESVWPLLHGFIQRVRSARPTPVHRAIAVMQNEGIVRHVLSLGVDDLLSRAGCRRVLHLSPSMNPTTCALCDHRTMRPLTSWGPRPERCSCGGIYTPDILLGGPVPTSDSVRIAEEYLNDCQLLLGMGVSGDMPPLTLLFDAVTSGGGRVVQIDSGVTSFPAHPTTLHLPFSFQRIIPPSTRCAPIP